MACIHAIERFVRGETGPQYRRAMLAICAPFPTAASASRRASSRAAFRAFTKVWIVSPPITASDRPQAGQTNGAYLPISR